MDTQITTALFTTHLHIKAKLAALVSRICKWNHRLALQKEAAAAAGPSIVSVCLVPPLRRAAVGGGGASNKDESERKEAVINWC